MKEIIDKWDLIQIFKFYSMKDDVKRMRRQTGIKYLQNTYLINNCYPTYTNS